jgi:hypothetical protein
MKIEHVIQEALPISQAKPYVKAWDPNFHKDVFERQPRKDKNAYRVYLPFEAQEKKAVLIPAALQAYLQSAIPNKPFATDADNYMQGLAYEVANPTRKLGIGKMLARSEASEKDPARKAELQVIKKAFDADPQRAATRKADKLIVISRHPYDVAGMSTDRGWRSCMNLVDGINRHYVLRDVKQGSIIAYLINADDLNVNKPLARILIKPYQEKGNPSNLAMMGDHVYGTAPTEFKSQVDAWINTHYNQDKSGLYCLAPGLYRDVIPQKVKLVSNTDLANLPQKDVVKLGWDDESTWHRIAKLRSDADEILTQIAEKSDSRAARLIKQIDIPRLTKAIKSRPQILARLHTQPPELVQAALTMNPAYVRFVRNRTAEQHEQVLKLLKTDAALIKSVHEPTPEQIQFAIKKESWLFSWALETHPHVLSEDTVRTYMLKSLKTDRLSWAMLSKIHDAFPKLFEDVSIVHALVKNNSIWIMRNLKLTPELVQYMILNSDYTTSRYADNWADEHEPKLINMLKLLPESEHDPKLLPTVTSKYPELIAAFPNISEAELLTLVKKQPKMIRFWPNPSPQLIYTALLNDQDYELEGEFREDKYAPIWIKLIEKDLEFIDGISDPAESILKAAAMHPKLRRYDAIRILRAPRVTPAVQVRILKRYPELIDYIQKPSLAAQIAAVNTDPEVYSRIRPKDRHPRVKAYMNAYRKEMRKPE